MRRYPVPNLRRDVPISVVLLVAALAAVVPHRAMVIMALAAIAGLMVLRFTVLSRISRDRLDAGHREGLNALARSIRALSSQSA